MNFAKYLRTRFCVEQLWWLLLGIVGCGSVMINEVEKEIGD